MGITVGRLWHHPVKSMRGEVVDEVTLGPGGLVGDRAYGLLDLDSGRLLSAKRPKRYGALLDCTARFASPPRPDASMPPVRVTLPDGTVVEGDAGHGDEIAKAVSELLKRDVCLVSSVPEGSTYDTIWPDFSGSAEFLSGMRQDEPEDGGEALYGVPPGIGAPGTLLDLAALHVLCTSTLDRYRSEYPDGVWDDRRFRPNIVFEDGPAPADRPSDRFTEDEWMGCDLMIGDSVRVHVVAPTLRCPMPTLPQGEELPRDVGILRTVNRLSKRQLGGLGTFPCVGAYAEVVVPGVIRTGDPVTVTETIAQDSALAAAVEMIEAGMRAAKG